MSNPISDYFDSLAQNWNPNPEDYSNRERIVQLAGLKPNSVIADIGCGRGVMFEHLLKTQPREIYAIDLSAKMIEQAALDLPDPCIHLMNADIITADLPLLDAAVIYNAYPHFLDKAALADKLAQIVKPGGLLIIAHGRGKQIINGGHGGKRVSQISIPLEEAQAEAEKFAGAFKLEQHLDTPEIYFIKLQRV